MEKDKVDKVLYINDEGKPITASFMEEAIEEIYEYLVVNESMINVPKHFKYEELYPPTTKDD